MHRSRLIVPGPTRRFFKYFTLILLALVCLGCRTCRQAGPEPGPGLPTSETVSSGQTVPPADVPSPSLGPVSLSDPVPSRSLTAEELDEDVHGAGLLVDVHFDLDRFELTEEARADLAHNAHYLSDASSVRLLIEGHCDERGTNEYNLALGQLRAGAAREYLMRLGVGGDRLDTISYGEDRGVCVESRETCWWRNRRAYFRIASTSKR
ncbi:MAG: OmpA family protein [bacterium]|nr:OmpA family protein [bacterium]